MKKMLLILVGMACLPGIVSAQVVEEIVARVNNQIITLSEFQRSKTQLSTGMFCQALIGALQAGQAERGVLKLNRSGTP